MNIDVEKDLALSCQERYEIIDLACRAAEDNGFMNSFVFERALYCYMALYLFEEKKDQITGEVNILGIWEMFLKDGTIDRILDEHYRDCSVLAEEGTVWFSEYAEYARSARNLLDAIQSMTTDMVQHASAELQESASSEDIQTALKIADKWGMNNTLPVS